MSAEPTSAERLTPWAAGLAFEEIPPRVLAYAKSQLLSQLAASRAGLAHPLGARITDAFGPPLQADAKRASYVLAALTMALDYDDALFAGHVSHSTVNVPLAHARALALDGRALLTAIVAANECAARITAAAALGPFRGQMASYAHLAGASAALLRAREAPPREWVAAFGLAFAAPPWSLRHPFLASDAKVLTAATCVRIALDACDAAAAGLAGPADVLEHERGFLARFSELPLGEALTLGLGERWHTETCSFKCAPAATAVQSSIDCARALHGELDGTGAERIEEVLVRASLLTVRSNEAALAYATGPEAPVSALQYSVPYCLATVLLHGTLAPGDFAAPAVREARRWRLAAKVRVEHDRRFSERALAATAPLGEALRLAGERAPAWLSAASGGEADISAASVATEPSAASASADGMAVGFERATKQLGARVALRLADGRQLACERIEASGAAGDATRARHPRLMREKFLACGGGEDTAARLAQVESLDAAELAGTIARALSVDHGSQERPM